VVLVILLGVGGFFYERAAEANDARRFPPPGQLVDVGGYKLHILCSGQGPVTVVIDAGLGDWSTSWSLVQPDLARYTKVCTYDRAGYGWSDAGPKPRSSQKIANELHVLLTNAGIHGPYVLVGHSFGGFNVREYYHFFPQDVKGVVLVDSSHPEQSKRLPPEIENLLEASMGSYKVFGLLERVSLGRVAGSALGLKAPNLEEAQRQAYLAKVLLPQYFQTSVDEYAALPESAAQVSESGKLGSLPIIVLSNGLGMANPAELPANISKTVVDQANQAWQQMQNELAGLSTQSEHLIAEKSYHNINIEQPASAVSAILRMVQSVRP
jgi:pimeloyl-ACP methyl ester carboxylesterase